MARLNFDYHGNGARRFAPGVHATLPEDSFSRDTRRTMTAEPAEIVCVRISDLRIYKQSEIGADVSTIPRAAVEPALLESLAHDSCPSGVCAQTPSLGNGACSVESKTPERRQRVFLQVLGIGLTIGICSAVTATPAVQSLSSGGLLRAEPTAVDAVNVVDIVERARRQFEAGRYLDAIDTLNTSTPSASSAAALMWLGRAHLELGDYAAAVAALERAVACTPADSESHRWLGRAYGEEADRARSLSLAGRVRREFEEAVRLDSTNIAAHRDLLQFHLDAPWVAGGRDGRARQELAKIAALDPVAGHLARGAYLSHHGDGASAAGEYRAVLESRTTNIDHVFEVAEFYERRGDAPGLRAAIEAATAINSGDPRALYYRGALDVMTRADLAGAESSLRAYLAVPPRSDRPSAADTHEWLGRLYERTGSLEKAVVEYRQVLALAARHRSANEALRRLERH
jgi:tetratricopeptide (TPR) repeat protein